MPPSAIPLCASLEALVAGIVPLVRAMLALHACESARQTIKHSAHVQIVRHVYLHTLDQRDVKLIVVRLILSRSSIENQSFCIVRVVSNRWRIVNQWIPTKLDEQSVSRHAYNQTVTSSTG